MKALTTAIYAKAVGSAFETAIGGRLYKGRASEGAAYPYAVYLLVSDVSDPTFMEQLEDVVIQFSLFSNASSSAEIEDIYTALKALYDDSIFTITGETLLYMLRQNATLTTEEHTTPAGTTEVWHYAVDYALMTRVG